MHFQMYYYTYSVTWYIMWHTIRSEAFLSASGKNVWNKTHQMWPRSAIHAFFLIHLRNVELKKELKNAIIYTMFLEHIPLLTIRAKLSYMKILAFREAGGGGLKNCAVLGFSIF